MIAAAPHEAQIERVRSAINEVVDPCSVGRGVPAGLVDMGMVCDLDVCEAPGGGLDVRITARLTSPHCAFHLYLDQRLRDRLAALEEVTRIEISWSRHFDWSDDDMSPQLKQRLRRRRENALAAAAIRRADRTGNDTVRR